MTSGTRPPLAALGLLTLSAALLLARSPLRLLRPGASRSAPARRRLARCDRSLLSSRHSLGPQVRWAPVVDLPVPPRRTPALVDPPAASRGSLVLFVIPRIPSDGPCSFRRARREPALGDAGRRHRWSRRGTCSHPPSAASPMACRSRAIAPQSSGAVRSLVLFDRLGHHQRSSSMAGLTIARPCRSSSGRARPGVDAR